jgi:hypothetical protein
VAPRRRAGLAEFVKALLAAIGNDVSATPPIACGRLGA